MAVGHCGECKHWARPGNGFLYGLCYKISDDNTEGYMLENTEGQIGEPAIIKALCLYEASGELRCRADFGCVLFEPRS